MKHLLTNVDDLHMHINSRMFALINETMLIAPRHVPWSYLEWFTNLGLFSGQEIDERMSEIVRGMYWDYHNSIYVYQGMFFNYSDRTKDKLLEHIVDLSEALSLREDCRIWLGPMDKIVHGIEYEKKYIGSVGCYVRRDNIARP